MYYYVKVSIEVTTSLLNISLFQVKQMLILRDLRFELYTGTYIHRYSGHNYTNYLHARTNFSGSKNLAIERSTRTRENYQA